MSWAPPPATKARRLGCRPVNRSVLGGELRQPRAAPRRPVDGRHRPPHPSTAAVRRVPRIIRLAGRLRRHAKPTTPRYRRHAPARLLRTHPVPVSAAAAPTQPSSPADKVAAERSTPTMASQRPATRWPASSVLRTAGSSPRPGCAAHLASVIGRHRVVDYVEAVVEPTVTAASVNGRIARVGLQDSCHLRNGLGGFHAPRQVLSMVSDYVEIRAADCRGAAGLLDPSQTRQPPSR
jgi:glycolate oxidase iron-sulfur subunit